MYNIDSLISLVDRLDTKSSELLKKATYTSTLAKKVSELHAKITIADDTIASLSDSIETNHRHLQEIDQIHEKSYYLESSLQVNDFLTSQTTWSNLYQEYKYITKKLEVLNDNNKKSKNTSNIVSHIPNYVQQLPANSIFQTPMQDRCTRFVTPSTTQTFPDSDFGLEIDSISTNCIESGDSTTVPKGLINSTSVSDIRLKPIRCRTKKMYKKKSKYRLSSIYTINPLSDSPMVEIPASDYESVQSPVIGGGLSLDNTVPKDDTSTICTTPDRSSNIFNPKTTINETSPFTSTSNYQHYKSNSVPDFGNIFNSKEKMKPNNILHNYENDNDFDRLKHFISYGNGLITHDISKTPEFKPTTVENIDLDHLSECTDFSYYSPEANENDTSLSDNEFEKYLRQSRVDLNSVLPNILTKSTSHESIFSTTAPHGEIQPIQEFSKNYNFHNPIFSLSSSAKVIEPTINEDYIYSNRKTSDQFDKKINSNESSPVNSKTLLNNFIKKQEQATDISRNSPVKKRFSIFNFASIDSVNDSTKTCSKSVSTGKTTTSLSENIMNIMKTPEKSKPNSKTCPIPVKNSIPRSEPIKIENPNISKRFPMHRKERNDGSHSKLTIGPNKQTIFSHGESSYFKKPLVSKVSRNSLHEALNFNLYGN